MAKNSALEKYSNQSYAPGVLSSAAGPSGDVGSVPRVRSVATESYSTDQFVVLPFGPKWSAAKIVDVSTETKEIEVSYLESSDQYKTFTWSDEPKCWEFQSRILMKLSHPQVSLASTNTRLYLTFSEDEVARENTAFGQWKQHKRKPRRV